MRDWFKRVFIHSLVKYIIIAVLAIIMVVINLCTNGFTYIYFVDGVQISGAAIILIGGLSLIGYYGAFDFWGYTFSRKQLDGRRIDISEYLEQKRVKKRSKNLPYPPYFLSGIIILLISLILLLFK